MTTEELEACFEKYSDDEFLKFERIEKPAHRRPDICAFIMLDALVDKRNARDGYSDMVAGAEHDEIYLAIHADELAAVATDEVVRDLVRCGVRYSTEHDCLAMFA